MRAVGRLHGLKRWLMRSRRAAYGLRSFVPGLREHHRLEAMVGPLGYWNELQRYQFELLVRHGLARSHRLLDIGCGPLQGGLAFIRYLDEGGYTGIDVDILRCNAAHEQVIRHGLASKCPRIVHSVTFGARELGTSSFDMMWASQVLYYFDKEVMNRLLRCVAHRLRPGGVLLADTMDPQHYEFTHPENPGRYVRHTHESLAGQAAAYGLAVQKLGTIHEYGYPRRLSLGSNPLYAISHASRGDT